MAIWNMASNIKTRETIWVSRNIVKGRAQLNSHRDDDLGRCYQRDGIDGFSAGELAGLHSPYAGNDWQSKYIEFISKWGYGEGE